MHGLRDNSDKKKGLIAGRETRQITTYDHIVQIDSRDCVGIKSLQDARQAFSAEGGRGEAVGLITHTSGKDINPTIIITLTTETLKNGDIVSISNVQGNTAVNNDWRISNLTASSFEIGAIGNGTYAGGGQWLRKADTGFPRLDGTTSVIEKNEMIIMLNKRLKAIKTISLNISIIPRDIIPIESYFKDLYSSSIGGSVTFIPQEKGLMIEESYGFYSTGLSIFRSYEGSFKVPNQSTHPPLKLWNPNIGDWPFQPLPYTHQTVPTYRSNTIVIGSSVYHLICSGYGVYDLKDWTGLTREETDKARRVLLKNIIRPQSYNKLNYIDIIEICSVTSNDISPYGYGDFQRFLCGPGLHLSYQPGTSDSANPSIPSGDWPISFPNFLGNVWGPYDAPGDRFQKLGLRDTLQDLFLNGDLDNAYGDPIIKNIKISEFMADSNYGFNDNFKSVVFSNYGSSTNLNIKNAMRIVPNGFGATNVIAQGSGNPLYSAGYQLSGGIGPSNLGTPSTWSTTGIYGVPSITDPNAVGPLSFNLLTNGTVPQTSVANLPANNTEITHRISWYDKGPNNGEFINGIGSYYRYLASNLPETNLVIYAFQFPRTAFVQSTKSEVGPSIFNVPIRLLPGTSDGGFTYVEGLYGLLTQSSDLGYWGQQFLNPIATLDKITLSFETYEGLKIPLEKMLSYKNRDILDTNPLIRTKNFISLLFRINCYQYVNIGLNDIVDKILGKEENEDEDIFTVKASNYEDY
jgi:hypothetical protein